MELFLSKEHLKYYNQDIFAKAGISVLYDFFVNSKEKERVKVLFDAKKELTEKDPNNIVLRNAITYFLFKLEQTNLKEAAEKKSKTIAKIDEANREIAQIASKKIKENSKVFVHSINNNIFDILVKTIKTKQIEVNLVEHRPFCFGNHLVKALKEKGIKAKIYPDINLKHAVLDSDICFIGGEAILKEGEAIAKVGSSITAELTKQNNIPLYVCCSSLKYDSKKELKEIIAHQHQKEENHDHDIRTVYELLQKDSIGSYICEQGVFKPEHILSEIKFYNSWML